MVQLGKLSERPNGKNVLTFYALGDWGTGNVNQKAVAMALRQNVAQIAPGRKIRPFVIGLGDNIYEHGLPQKWNDPDVKKMLQRTFGAVYSDVMYEGQQLTFHIVPGNHDYNGRSGGKNGYGDVLQEETTAEKMFAPYWKYYPIDPDKNSDTNDFANYQALKKQNIFTLTIPEELPIESKNRLLIVAIDSQVLLDLYNKNDTTALKQHFDRLDELLKQPAAWKLIIGHHPIATHGLHGGFRTAIWWIPPVTLLALADKFLYKPLQDLDHPAYRKFQHGLFEVMKKNHVKTYLSGHEHNLQFLKLGNGHFQIVSGSAGKLTSVTHKNDTIFSNAALGFTRFDITDNEMWIEFITVNPENKSYRSAGLFKIKKN